MPLQFVKNSGFTIADTSEKVKQRINGVTHLLILKDKKTGNMKSVLMNIFSDNGIADSSITYSKRKANFNGNIFFTDLNGDFINGWKYKSGKITNRLDKLKNENKSVSISKKNVSPNNIKEDRDCTNELWYIWEGTCYLDLGYCTDWIIVGSYYVNSCPNGGGSGGVDEGSEEEKLEIKAKQKLEDLVASGLEKSDPCGVVNISGDSNSRIKEYCWIFYGTSNGSWFFKSYERGTHTKINNPDPNLAWKWESLQHLSITREGFVTGGDVICTLNSTNAIIGSYNSGMVLNYNIESKVSYAGYNFSDIRTHHSQIYFNVKE